MSSVDDDDDDKVAKLDSYSLQIIDDAFDNAVGWVANARPSKRRRLTRTSAKESAKEDNPGGFIVDDVEMEMDTSGGFIPERLEDADLAGDDNSEKPQTISLSLIPTALASLGLPSDDDEIMEVFKNASSGWSASRGNGLDGSGSVSRRDWRAVCAVLLPNGISKDGRFTEDSDDAPNDDLDFSVEKDEEESDLTDLTEEEYQPSGNRTPATKTSTRKRKSKSRARVESSDEDDGIAKPLSSRQKRDCRAAFALFFPDLDADSPELDTQRLTISVVARCAGLLKEKLSAEDIIEMLRTFSSDASNNPSIKLSDFERIMTATKLV